MDTIVTTQNARKVIIECLGDCPLQKSDENCFFCNMRKKPREDQIEWLQAMSDEECYKFYRNHMKCFWHKLGDHR